MELLQEKRIPLKKNNVYINNEIKTKYNLHENNNNSLDDFIKILSERYNLILASALFFSRISNPFLDLLHLGL